jgi:hypothetical protein
MKNLKKGNNGCSSAGQSCMVERLRGRTGKKRTPPAREIRQRHKESRQINGREHVYDGNHCSTDEGGNGGDQKTRKIMNLGW